MSEKHTRLPPWLSKKIPQSGESSRVRHVLKDLRVSTVCREARCPNLCECFSRGTATFMILGRNCSRSCRFCAVSSDRPEPPEPDEPQRVGLAARRLKLRHVVITSVTRDDLPDGGSEHFALTVKAVRGLSDSMVEVLTPDFNGVESSINRVIDADPDIYNHNIETVPRLYPEIRPQADYKRSLWVIRQAAERGLRTKSGLMLGLGESQEEIVSVMEDLIGAGCHFITMGQYLAPTQSHFRVKEFVPPSKFKRLGKKAHELGFLAVASAPFVRSSYNADLLARESFPLNRSM